MAIKKITLKTVKKMNELWEERNAFGYGEDKKEERKKAEEVYHAFKKENYDYCTEIEDEAVMELLKEPYTFILPSVNKISLIALKLVGSSDIHSLELNGFEEFTDEQTEALSGLANRSRNYRSRDFRFDSLKTLNTGFYHMFLAVKCGGTLKLNGITELTEGDEKAMSKFKFSHLELNGLRSITPKGFKSFKGTLSFAGLDDIPLDVVEGMKKWKMGGLKLRNLKKISVEFAKAIAERTDQPYLMVGHTGDGETNKYGDWVEGTTPYGPELSLDSMTELMKGKYYRISFNGVTDLTPEVAAVINKNPTMIDLQQMATADMNQDAFKALSAKSEFKYCESIFTKDVTIDRAAGEVRPKL